MIGIPRSSCVDCLPYAGTPGDDELHARRFWVNVIKLIHKTAITSSWFGLKLAIEDRGTAS